MDIFSLTLTGNLTDNCVLKNLEEKNKKVINFTLASNLKKDNPIFLDCSYWMDENMDPENKIAEILVKGKKVTINSNYIKIQKSENKENNTKYEKVKITVSQIVF